MRWKKLRAEIALRIYMDVLRNQDGTYQIISSGAAVQHADTIIKALKK